MSLTLKDARKGQGAIAPAGSHPARCFSIIDLGSHTEDGAFGITTNRKIRFSWELPDELHVFDEQKGPQPFVVHRTLNFIISPRSNFQKMLESWRGRAFTEQELDSFEIKKVLGAPCMISIVHATKNNQTYANVDAVLPLPAKWKQVMSAPVNKQVYYEIEYGQNATFKALPEWVRTQILSCNELKGSKQVEEVPSSEEDPFQQTAPATEEAASSDDDDGDIPF